MLCSLLNKYTMIKLNLYYVFLISATFPFSSGKGRSKWPIHCYAPLDVNANSGSGGCLALLQISCAYGGKSSETTAETCMIRFGYNGNHIHKIPLAQNHNGHFGCENSCVTDENGRLLPDLMFGNNHVSLISSDPRHGNLSHGRHIFDDSCLNLNVNGSLDGESGGGCTLVLCVGWLSGIGESTLKGN